VLLLPVSLTRSAGADGGVIAGGGVALEALNRTGCVAVNLVRDFDLASFDDIDKRIVGISLTSFKVGETTNAHLSVDIRFVHGGESVIHGKARDPQTGGAQYRYYWFRPASGDDPISWGFTYNHADRAKEATPDPVYAGGGITPDVKDSERQKQEAALLKGLLGSAEEVAYNEYFPSFFSDITLRLNPGHFKTGVIPPITELTFKVTFSGRGTKS